MLINFGLYRQRSLHSYPEGQRVTVLQILFLNIHPLRILLRQYLLWNVSLSASVFKLWLQTYHSILKFI